MIKILFLTLLALISSQTMAAYKLLELHVDSEGSDVNDASKMLPIKSLFEAQKRADLFLSKLDPNGLNKNDYIKVRIIVSGTFYGQSFSWNHPHKSVHLHIKAAPDSAPVFYGYKHACFNCVDGTTFFSAYAKLLRFTKDRGFSGYGSIAIEGLTIKYYGTGMNLAAWKENRPGPVNIVRNTFYKMGQIVNPDHFKPLYSAIILDTINGAVVEKNTFLHIGNNADDQPALMHGIYLMNSDRNEISKNRFNNISGEPVKIRNGSDHNKILSNTFRRGASSVHVFPIQNWYADWWRSDEQWLELDPNRKIENREIPSFGNIVDNNLFENGYLSTPVGAKDQDRQSICNSRTFSAPAELPATYQSAASSEKTASRFIINGTKIYHTHWYHQNCGF